MRLDLVRDVELTWEQAARRLVINAGAVCRFMPNNDRRQIRQTDPKHPTESSARAIMIRRSVIGMSLMKIFEISFGRTGTSSLSKAAEILGYRVLHGWGDTYGERCLKELFDGQLPSCIDQYDFVSDIAAPFFQELDEAYPGSKFILPVRDEKAWLDSWINHSFSSGFHPRKNYQTFYRLLKLGCFWPHKNPTRALRAYRSHRQAVTEYFRNRPEDLLVIDTCAGEGWEPLCAFFDKPIPDVPFPHENRSRFPDKQTADKGGNERRPVSDSGTKETQSLSKTVAFAQARHSPRLLFASYHCYLDPSSGAAISMRDLLEGLSDCGWSAKVFTGPLLDFEKDDSPTQLLCDQRIPYEEKAWTETTSPFSVLHFQEHGVPATIFRMHDETGKQPSPDAAEHFLALFDQVLDQFQPHVLLTYGGQGVGSQIMKRARQRGVRVVFTLRNFAYHNSAFFQHADAILVPSQFSVNHYRNKLGLDSVAIPSPINWSRIRCEPEAHNQKYVTFVNPQPNKGVYVFIRIAHELARKRPDIPLLIVEGRSQVNWLARCPLDLSGLKNLNLMANTPDPRDFYKVSRILLMPSLWNESFGRVAAEALINGIPVLGSNRGALPEVLEETGFLFDIPAKYTPRATLVPTRSEIAPWVETIIRLWDDRTFYEKHSRAAQSAAEKWHPERVLARYDHFFRNFLT